MHMKKKIILGAILLFFVSFNFVEACTPPMDWDPQPGDVFYNHPTIFAGTVKEVNSDLFKSKIEIKFVVDVIFNGDIPKTEVTVVTNLGSTMCGYEIGDFKKGDIWIVSSSGSGDTLNINHFSGSEKFKSYEEVFDFESRYAPMMVGCGIAPDGVTDLGSCYIYNRFEEDDSLEQDDIIVEPVVCTADAIQCSDGSWVGRTGPNCEFICPKIKQEILDEPISVEYLDDNNDLLEESDNKLVEEPKKKNIFTRFWNWLTDLF